MIQDFLISFKDNFKDKTRNPFLGTYLMVWIIRNWELIYTLFNFDSDNKLNFKIEFIKKYYTNNNFLENLMTNLYWAFGLLVLTYFLLNISRLIVNLFEKQLTPWIYKITDSKSIVIKETYDKLKNENVHLELQLEKERESKGRLQIEISKLEQRIEELILSKEKQPTENTQSNEKIGFENEVDLMFDKIKQKGWIKNYIDAAFLINKNEFGWVNKKDVDEPFQYFIKLGLFDATKEDTQDYGLTITDLGNKVLRRLRLEL